MKIIISPYSRKLVSGNQNPKDFPYWKELVRMLKKDGHILTQIGIDGENEIGCDKFIKNIPLKDLKKLLDENDTFISVDSFFQHFAWYYNKKGIVIFSQSNPKIFGHDIHVNILKDEKYLKPDQYGIWNNDKYVLDSFVDAIYVYDKFNEVFK